MGKQIKKEIVPSRERRLEKIGDPKTPKMGGVTPKTVKVPNVGDLLDKMKEVTAPSAFKFISYDFEVREHGGKCSAGCQCPPCLLGACINCYVEAVRHDEDREAVRAKVARYRTEVLT